MFCKKSSANEKRCLYLLYCFNGVQVKVGGQIPWNVAPICETSLVECHPTPAKDQSESINLRKKSDPDCSSDAHDARGIWKRGVLIADLEELETMDA